MNMPINASAIKTIIRSIYMFDNINIAFKLTVNKVSLKSDMAIA